MLFFRMVGVDVCVGFADNNRETWVCTFNMESVFVRTCLAISLHVFEVSRSTLFFDLLKHSWQQWVILEIHVVTGPDTDDGDKTGKLPTPTGLSWESEGFKAFLQQGQDITCLR